MNNWLYPTTLFGSAFIVWIFGALFFKKKTFVYCVYLSTFLAMIGILILFFNGYSSLGLALLCIVFSLFLLHFGLDFSFSKKTSSGPFASFLHQEGIACSYLEPKGEIEIQEKKIPAVTEGLTIVKGSKVRVIRCGPKFVVVEKCEKE